VSYTPWKDRQIGLEIELTKRRTTGGTLTSTVIKNAVGRALADVGAPARLLNPREVGWYKSNGETWDIKTDATCGWEVASRALMLNEFGNNEELERVCHHIGALNPSVTNQCGLHMHIQARDLSWHQLQNLVWLWARYEPYWFSLVPAYRRERSYCAPICSSLYDGIPNYTWDTSRRLITGHRDHASADAWPRASLNLRPWWSSGRVEVRLHHGSISYTEMQEWAMLMLALVERAKLPATPIEPYEPRARSRPFSTEYIGAMLYLDRPNVHSAATWLLRQIEARRAVHNPESHLHRLGIIDDTDPLSRIRDIRDNTMAGTVPRQRRSRRTTVVETPTGIVAPAEDDIEQARIALLRESQRTRRGRRRP
jgi:hypothetical protein